MGLRQAKDIEIDRKLKQKEHVDRQELQDKQEEKEEQKRLQAEEADLVESSRSIQAKEDKDEDRLINRLDKLEKRTSKMGGLASNVLASNVRTPAGPLETTSAAQTPPQ